MISNRLTFVFLNAFAAFVLLCSSVTAAPPQLTAAQKTDVENTLNVAKEAFLAGNLQRTAHLIGLAANIDPSVSPALTTMAKWSASLGRADVARKLLDDAVDNHPNDPEAMFLLADIARLEGRRTEATLLLARGQELLEAFKDSPVRRQAIERSMWSNLANLYEMKGNYDNALTCLGKLIDLEEPSGTTFLRQGLIYLKRNQEGDKALGLKAFERAFELDPTQLPPKAQLAHIMLQQGEVDSADTLLNEALVAYPEHGGLLTLVATTHMSLGRLEKANEIAAILQRQFPDSPNVLKLKGTLAMSLRNLDEAETCFRQLLEKQPEVETVNGLLMILLDKGNEQALAEAAALAESTMRQAPSQDGAVLLAWSFFLQGKKETAERLVDQVLSGERLSPNGVFYVASILIDQGKTDLAQKILKAAVESNIPFFKRTDAEKLLATLNDAT